MYLLILLCVPIAAAPSQKVVRDNVDNEIPSLLKLYQYLHANPEISFQEEKTGQRLGAEMKKIGTKMLADWRANASDEANKVVDVFLASQ